ncbi:MBL fold metallo-hydrolase [Amycolatopsis sp. PS_44_ISF1]|uniref:MBL fold metallo-hydrolase n=1 Tax=Amycolatopsis sp. PS_44_ISF1 TaxID=2974917 RepID=UPI0028E06C0C|nr:MBL fold metallo-hydrolase [Amycolatopsis sp. PS_44_ISF1]MDT8913627.1 MBL fold metallo-hydrolase [Amycolatopsis sp. PS_44_ISF1]
MTSNAPTELSYQVFVSDGVPRHTDVRLPDGGPIISSPLSSTLIHGRHDAVLVDPSWTIEQTTRLGDWIEATGVRLRAIYITHGHGDHWFGTAQLLERFPGATVYATDGTIRLMHRQATSRPEFWDVLFPGLIGETPVLAQSVPHDGFTLEGHRLVPVETGHTDTDDTTVLHVPDLGLVVAGDVVYNGVHQMLQELGETGLQSWLDALDTVEALHPRAVVAGHKNRALPDDPAAISHTRQYLLDARELLATSPSPSAFFDEMSARHPQRLNLGPLWNNALTLLS